MIGIGQKIRYFRKSLNKSLKEVAIDIDVSPSFLSKIETNEKKCSLETLEKICTALGITLGQFFADTQEPESETLSPEARRVMDKIKDLPLDKLKILEAVLDSWTD